MSVLSTWSRYIQSPIAITSLFVAGVVTLAPGVLVTVHGVNFLAQTSPTQLPLVQLSDIQEVGAFLLPSGGYPAPGAPDDRFGYGGTAPGYYKDAQNRDTLYMQGHAWYPGNVAQIQLPAIVNSHNINSLNRATVLQGFRDISDRHLGGNAGDQIGSIMAYNGKLTVGSWIFYDASGSQNATIGDSSFDLTQTGDFRGYYNSDGINPGRLGKYMTTIPEEWRALFGKPALNGACCGSIISRTNSGPGVSMFDPDVVGTANPVPFQELVGYPLDHPVQYQGLPSGCSVQSSVFNCTTSMAGVAFPAGTRSVLFFGAQGTGPICYKDEGAASCRGTGGYNAPPFKTQIWAYDANDLLAVKNGQMQPWQISPYAIWTTQYEFNVNGVGLVGGTFDPETNRMFLIESNGEDPIGHVLKINTPAGGTTSTSSSSPSSSVASSSSSFTISSSSSSSSSSPVASSSSSAGPVLRAAYCFEEGTGTSVANKATYGGSATTSNTTWTAGHNGKALSYNGTTSNVALGNPTWLQLQGSMTVSAWIRTSAFPYDDAAIVSKRGGGSDGYQLDTTIDMGPRTIGFKLTNANGQNMMRYGQTAMQTNQWYYVTGVYNAQAQTMDVYLNGVLDNGTLLGTVTSSQQNSTLPVFLGKRAGLSGYEHSGVIDDVRIYASALTSSQILVDMNASVCSPAATSSSSSSSSIVSSSSSSSSSVPRSSSSSSSSIASSPSSSSSSVSSSNSAPLRLAFCFEDGTGTKVTDQSTYGNNGVISKATWTTAGKFGKALTFNGSNAWVTITGNSSLDLKAAMTLEAWVYPSSTPNLWKQIILKQRPGGLAYALYATGDVGKPNGYINVGAGDIGATGPTKLGINKWSHIAVTYDNNNIRYYVNGIKVATQAATGNMVTATTSPLRLGGNSVWGEYFSGRIDDVRVYAKALSDNDIKADMNKSVCN